MKLLIGLVGEKGAGKGTFAQLLAERCGEAIEVMRFSDILRATLSLWDIPESRENLKRLSLMMDKEFGGGVLARALSAHIVNSSADVVLLDGARWKEDVDLLRGLPHNILVYITAPLEVRFERQKRRGENVGETSMTFEQFIDEEQAPNELLIPTLGATANVVVRNEGSAEDFEKAVDEFYGQYITVL